MNESLALDGVDNLNMETSHLSSFTQWLHAGVLANDRFFIRNDAALAVLLIGLCVGLLLLLCFLFAVCCKSFDTRTLTVFKVSLVFTGLLQSLSTPVIAMHLMSSTCSLTYCNKIFAVWHSSKRCGMLLHLLVVLEFIWTQSRGNSKILPLYWSLPVVLTLDLICILFFEVIEAAVALGAMAMTLTLVICVLACCSLKSLDNRLKKAVLTGLLTFAIICCPLFVIECMIIKNEPISFSIHEIFLCGTNLRLITDGYLCWLTCRENPVEAPEQMEIGQVNADFFRQAQVEQGEVSPSGK